MSWASRVKRTHFTVVFRSIALGLVLAPCTVAQSRQEAPSIPWDKMIWMPADVGGKTVEHAALLVDLRLAGITRPLQMQLDTGCDSDLVYEAALRFLGLPGSGNGRVTLGGTLGGRRFQAEPFHVRTSGASSLLAGLLHFFGLSSGSKPVLLGTIGAEFLEQRVLLLDFVAQRLAFLDKGEELPGGIARSIEFAPIEYRDRKIFLTLRVNGVRRQDLFFDTGSSAAAVVTTRSNWLEWTGRKPEDPNNTVIMANSWGREARLLGAPLRGAICVGSACASGPVVQFESTGLANFDFVRYGFPTSGLIGNALFDGRFTVIVDLPHRRFGLFPGSLSRSTVR